MAILLLSLISAVLAHPFSTDEYSYRTVVKMSDKGLQTLVVLEVPIPVVAAETGIAKGDPGPLQKKKIESYNAAVWERMGEGLTMQIDGAAVAGDWLAIEHPQNGKAGEGFFVYMVAFRPASEIAYPERFTVSVGNVGYPGEKMVYTADAAAKDSWSVAESSLGPLLGDKLALPLDDPERWSRDESLRTVTVTLAKGGT